MSLGATFVLPDANYDLAYETETTCASRTSPLQGSTSVNVNNSAPVVVLTDDGSWRLDDDGYTYPLTAGPGMPLRNSVSGDVATWRVEPRLAEEHHASTRTVRFGTQSWCDAPPVPVRAYVARGSIDLATGEVTSDLEPVDEARICVGSAWFHPESSAPGGGYVLSSCGAEYAAIVSLPDAFTPENYWYYSTTSDAIGGYAVGIASAPREPGSYLLVVEPTANAGVYDFLRDGAWRNIPWTDEWKGQIAVPFEVLGGAFLDADYQVVTDTLHVSDPVAAYVRVEVEDPGSTFAAEVVYEEEGAVVSTTPVTLDRVGTVAGRYGVFLGEIELVAATRLHRGVLAAPGAPDHSRTPQIAVGMDGFLRAYQSSKAVGPPLAEAHTSTLEVSVTNIVFNHAAGSLTGDAIELRKDSATTLPRPEYTRGGESYAAYVGGTTPVTVQVRFEVVSPDPVDSVTVHAFSDDGPDGGTLSKTDQKVVSFMNGASQEGTDDPTTSWDDSEYVTFTLANPIPSQISRSYERWIWQVDELNEYPVDHLFSADASGPHHTYVLYAAPEVPWTQTVDEPHNPWVSILDLACDWAQGTPSSGIGEPLEQHRAIVNALIPGAYEGMANTGKTYDPAESHCNGATDCDLTAIVSPSAVGNRTLDCFDASGLVVLSGRAIGVAEVSRNKVFGTFWLGAKFVTQPIMPFRLEPNAVLCPSGRCWRSYFILEHSFAWFDNRVFDGMIKVNMDDPRYPRDEPCAGVECAGSYRDDVLAPGSEWELFGFEDITEFH
jgi:hypothetical protein